LIWDISSLANLQVDPSVSLPSEKLDLFWLGLAHQEAAIAYKALHKFSAAGDQTVNFFREQLGNTIPIEDQFKQLLPKLADKNPAIRENATLGVAVLMPEVRPALKQALEAELPAEAHRRITVLLGKAAPERSGRQLRELRAVQILELIGTEKAWAFLEELANRQPRDFLANEAKDTLERKNSRQTSQ